MTYSNGSQNAKIDGVQCQASNCVYNNGGNICTAGSIQVDNCYDDASRTKCATFREV